MWGEAKKGDDQNTRIAAEEKKSKTPVKTTGGFRLLSQQVDISKQLFKL